MPTYLSKEWIRQADAALRASGLRTTGGKRFAVEQRVDGTVLHMLFDANGACVRPGPADNPTVVFSQSRSTAAAIARGEFSAEEAVLNGQTAFEGDPKALVANHHILATADDVFADLRSRTIWD
ncbi:SCP2 sterol-binding domain-containing protein [Candidatus Poriferisocius sp.]|uniref:SCP2 sterol-binding domain-containing protein n=1 Tax=Candidatus Poriferisocius sp. TaxID=3101276 RepID=UPI003B014C70